MADLLILGGFVFQPGDYSPPSRMPFGGAQAMAVHKLPGGNRVIDTLGPDEDDISWSGFFFCSPNPIDPSHLSALDLCKKLDGLRAQGTVLDLTYAGMSRQVVIKHFKPHIRRYPHWVEYEIDCVVSTNPFTTAAGLAAAISLTSADALIAADLATAAAAAAAVGAAAGGVTP